MTKYDLSPGHSTSEGLNNDLQRRIKNGALHGECGHTACGFQLPVDDLGFLSNPPYVRRLITVEEHEAQRLLAEQFSPPINE